MKRSDISDHLVCCVHAYWQTPPLPKAATTTEMLVRITGAPERVCMAAQERALDRGLLDYGVSLRTGWPTDAGKALIADTDPTAHVRALLN